MAATATQNGDGICTYEVHFLPVGGYTAAFTCQAGDDAADNEDTIWFPAFARQGGSNPLPRPNCALSHIAQPKIM